MTKILKINIQFFFILNNLKKKNFT